MLLQARPGVTGSFINGRSYVVDANGLIDADPNDVETLTSPWSGHGYQIYTPPAAPVADPGADPVADPVASPAKGKKSSKVADGASPLASPLASTDGSDAQT